MTGPELGGKIARGCHSASGPARNVASMNIGRHASTSEVPTIWSHFKVSPLMNFLCTSLRVANQSKAPCLFLIV